MQNDKSTVICCTHCFIQTSPSWGKCADGGGGGRKREVFSNMAWPMHDKVASGSLNKMFNV